MLDTIYYECLVSVLQFFILNLAHVFFQFSCLVLQSFGAGSPVMRDSRLAAPGFHPIRPHVTQTTLFAWIWNILGETTARFLWFETTVWFETWNSWFLVFVWKHFGFFILVIERGRSMWKNLTTHPSIISSCRWTTAEIVKASALGWCSSCCAFCHRAPGHTDWCCHYSNQDGWSLVNGQKSV